jgi:ATP synthase I subunit
VTQPQTAEPAQQEWDFYREVFRRLVQIMMVLAVLGFPAAWMRYGLGAALSFVLGSAIAILNFYWLRRTIEAMSVYLQATGEKPSSARVVARFALRYLLIAAAAYAILRGTTNGLYGLFAGLSLPAAAILIDAVYEVSAALRKGL